MIRPLLSLFTKCLFSLTGPARTETITSADKHTGRKITLYFGNFYFVVAFVVEGNFSLIPCSQSKREAECVLGLTSALLVGACVPWPISLQRRTILALHLHFDYYVHSKQDLTAFQKLILNTPDLGGYMRCRFLFCFGLLDSILIMGVWGIWVCRFWLWGWCRWDWDSKGRSRLHDQDFR